MDSIADFLTMIKNGIHVAKPFVIAPYSRIRHEVAKILFDEGFVRDVIVLEDKNYSYKRLQIFFKYYNGESVIHEIDRVSKPSRRVYAGQNNIKPVVGKLGITILSTNKGVISHKKAKEFGVGGEVLCTVW